MCNADLSAMAVTLSPYVSGDLDQVTPMLRAIWPGRADAIVESMRTYATSPGTEQMHLVVAGELVVGITGYYRYAGSDSWIGLCWHGIDPAYRGCGFGAEALRLVAELALIAHPKARYLVELVPSDRPELAAYFESQGFRPTGQTATFDWLPAGPTWHVYKAPLHRWKIERGGVQVLPVRTEHEDGWRELWELYCDGAVDSVITNATWQRMLDPQSSVSGIVATLAGEVVGFTTFIEHDCTWELGAVCYVEDLFVSKPYRGRRLAVGIAMAKHLIGRLEAGEWSRLYGITSVRNDVAQNLYNQFAVGHDYKRYVIKPTATAN